MFVCGPSHCGKTVFIAKLLENISVFAKSPPEKVIYVYKIWQSLFDDFTTQGLVHVFLQDQENLIDRLREEAFGESTLIIFDDLMNSKSLEDIGNLFVVDGRHSNYAMIFTAQRMFVNNEYFRQISNNSDYYVIFRNPRNYSEIRTLAQQITPLSLDLLNIYSKACQSPFTYLFINLTQECDEKVKFLSHLFENNNYIKVYVTSKQL